MNLKRLNCRNRILLFVFGKCYYVISNRYLSVSDKIDLNCLDMAVGQSSSQAAISVLYVYGTTASRVLLINYRDDSRTTEGMHNGTSFAFRNVLVKDMEANGYLKDGYLLLQITSKWLK